MARRNAPLCANPAVPIAARLAHAVTAYDRRQANRRHYNVYALPQYLARAQDVASRIAKGASVRDAVSAGFSGSLQAFILKALDA